MKKLALIALACVGLAGCNSEKVHTVDELVKDDASRERIVAECLNNPGKLRDTPNCINAAAAKKIKETYTVEQFENDKELMYRIVKQCRGPEAINQPENCRNAFSVYRKIPLGQRAD